MTRLIAACLVLAAAGPLFAQSPVVNAVVEKRTPSGDLARDIRAAADRPTPAWVGYRVPIARRSDAAFLSYAGCCGQCRLAPSTDLVVLARVQRGEVLELRPIAVDCDMDAGGMPLIWFEPVTADASIAWLNALVTAPPEGRGRIADQALSAIAQHAGQGAATALVKFAQSGTTTQMRGRALSALAQRAADQALPTIDAALQKDPDTEVKKLAVTALTRFPNGEGIPKLMDVARTHPNAEVRRHAMLRLADTKDPRAVDFFAQILLK
ncbi:MAG TPA: HEAT repeat domain-containing protein [Vicinamibacterales bacterium]|nr:HEAT repeat domain-containing protein [Vicinamibacterales bacterium]